MKTTVDIPDHDLREVIKLTGAKTKKDAILTAIRKFNRRKQLEALSERLHGALPNFITQDDLKALREDAKWQGKK